MLPVTTIGVVLAIMGTFMIVPSSIGIAEYTNADAETKKKEKVQLGLQCIILVGSIAIMIAGFSIMYQSHTLSSLVNFGFNGHKNLIDIAREHINDINTGTNVGQAGSQLVDKLISIHGPEKAQQALNIVSRHITKFGGGLASLQNKLNTATTAVKK